MHNNPEIDGEDLSDFLLFSDLKNQINKEWET